jgi:hypothetical protein
VESTHWRRILITLRLEASRGKEEEENTAELKPAFLRFLTGWRSSLAPLWRFVTRAGARTLGSRSQLGISFCTTRVRDRVRVRVRV